MLRLLLAALLLFALPTATMAQNDDRHDQDPLAAAAENRASQVVEVIQGSKKPEDVFSAEFLKAVPVSQLQTFRKQLTDASGAAQTVENFAYKGNGAATLTIR